MLNNDKKITFQSTGTNSQQNIIVILGLWICVATVALIFILNYTARRKSSGEQRRTEVIEHVEQKPNHTRHTAIATARTYMTKQ